MNIVIASVCSHFSLFPSLLFCLSVCACVCLSRSLFCPLSLFLPLYSSTIEKCTARVTLIVVVRLAFVVQPNEMFVLCFVFFVSTRHQTEKLDLLGFLTFRMSSSFHRVNCVWAFNFFKTEYWFQVCKLTIISSFLLFFVFVGWTSVEN